jgi:hypothetical protein
MEDREKWIKPDPYERIMKRRFRYVALNYLNWKLYKLNRLCRHKYDFDETFITLLHLLFFSLEGMNSLDYICYFYLIELPTDILHRDYID